MEQAAVAVVVPIYIQISDRCKRIVDTAAKRPSLMGYKSRGRTRIRLQGEQGRFVPTESDESLVACIGELHHVWLQIRPHRSFISESVGADLVVW